MLAATVRITLSRAASVATRLERADSAAFQYLPQKSSVQLAERAPEKVCVFFPLFCIAMGEVEERAMVREPSAEAAGTGRSASRAMPSPAWAWSTLAMAWSMFLLFLSASSTRAFRVSSWKRSHHFVWRACDCDASHVWGMSISGRW